eukprot:TRINITY_DN22903_c0_g1_i4.p1 TRINITY_DN22903_c0_g1~~TRINITY_DN22903_c0_g1_i4.p1  ORF type:complete len:195 (+),score=45.34 TRINITY_DN22903_c0_g1_i4:102-686(+)
MGKSEAQPESKEILQALERLHDANRNFTNLVKTTSSVFSAFPKADNDGKLFLEHEIKFANKLEKDYKIARLDYDARSETLRDATQKQKKDKIPAAQKSMDESTESYEKVKAELQKAINYIDEQREKIHKDTIRTCCDLLKGLKPDWEKKEGELSAEEPLLTSPDAESSTVATTTTTTTTTTSTSSEAESGEIDD